MSMEKSDAREHTTTVRRKCSQPKMSVLIDGPTVAALFCSHSNSLGNQEGFLFGQISNHVKDHISDTQISNSQVQTYIHVSSYLPWPHEDCVYSRQGVPILEKMNALVGKRKEEVVGWYSFRRNSTLRMSMKEQTLHKMLATKLFPHLHEDFIFFLCTATGNTNFSTHSMDHFFIKGPPGKLTKVSIKILNLGETIHSEYKTHVNAAVMQSESLKSILNEHRPHFLSESKKMLEMVKIDEMSYAVHSRLKTICGEVAEIYQKTGEMKKKVWCLQQELRRRETMKSKVTAPSSIESLEAGGGEPRTGSLTPALQVLSTSTQFLDTMAGAGEVIPVNMRKIADMGGLASAGERSCKKEHTSKGGLSIDEILSVNTLATESTDLTRDCLQPATSPASDAKGQSLNSVSLPSIQSCADGKAVKEKVEQTNDTGRKRIKREEMNIDQPPTTSRVALNPGDHFGFVENVLSTASKYGRVVEEDGAEAAKGQNAALISEPQAAMSQAREEAIQARTRLKQNMQMTKPDSCSTSLSASASNSTVPPDPCSSLSVLNKNKNVDMPEVCVSVPDRMKKRMPEAGRIEKQQLSGGHHEQMPTTSSASHDKDSKSGSELSPAEIFSTSGKQDKSGSKSHVGAGLGSDLDIHENGMNRDEKGQALPSSSSPVF